MNKLFVLSLFLFFYGNLSAQHTDLINNPYGRNYTGLNGEWKIIVDPYENGYYSYRYEPLTNGFFKNAKPTSKSDLIEYDFDKSDSLIVPGDWNMQRKELFFYEGTIWYKKSFNWKKSEGKRLFLYFSAVNYEAKVYLNVEFIGEHAGGFTPFNFEITDKIKNGGNFVVVKVDNKRKREDVPTSNTDWWNYGGITRDVLLIETPKNFIQDYFIQLKKNSPNIISASVKLSGLDVNKKVTIQIPDAKISETITTDAKGFAAAEIKASRLKLWSPANPYLYNVKIICDADSVNDEIGFRTIETRGTEILLNNKSVFLKGISIHEEAPLRGGRANTVKDAEILLSWAKELGCNFVRLAHYPHNEFMIRTAERMGLMVWSEIPVYWTIQWENKLTLENAVNQLDEMITRDKNRAPIIIWSVGNETPRGDARLKFMKSLIDEAHRLDPTRLISAATELQNYNDTISINDPLGEYLDVIGANEYIGWYGGKPEDAPNKLWKSNFNKPLIISEFGGSAKSGFHGDTETRFTEEYQENLYAKQIEMLKKIPFLRGVTPWILMDFRSPRRLLPGIQDYFNRKGLISDQGEKKKAFFILQNFYNQIP